METIITASICLYKIGDQHFMKVITADEYNFYHVPITKLEAIAMSDAEGLRITRDRQHPESSFLVDNQNGGLSNG